MCKLCIKSSIIATLFMYPVPSFAMNAQGNLDADIVAPQSLEYSQLKEFCADEPQTVFCSELKDTIESNTTNTDEDIIIEYSVFTGNYQ